VRWTATDTSHAAINEADDPTVLQSDVVGKEWHNGARFMRTLQSLESAAILSSRSLRHDDREASGRYPTDARSLKRSPACRQVSYKSMNGDRFATRQHALFTATGLGAVMLWNGATGPSPRMLSGSDWRLQYTAHGTGPRR
jgi:hypothetical protein